MQWKLVAIVILYLLMIALLVPPGFWFMP